jgi:hypothetical protein
MLSNSGEMSKDHHVEYIDITQHWCDKSEKFAGADALVTYLTTGWEIEEPIEYGERDFAGMRAVRVYYVKLSKDDETKTMPVLHNPYVNRLLRREKIELVPMNA